MKKEHQGNSEQEHDSQAKIVARASCRRMRQLHVLSRRLPTPLEHFFSEQPPTWQLHSQRLFCFLISITIIKKREHRPPEVLGIQRLNDMNAAGPKRFQAGNRVRSNHRRSEPETLDRRQAVAFSSADVNCGPRSLDASSDVIVAGDRVEAES